MKPPGFRARRAALWGLLILAIAGLAAPFLSANWFAARIQQTLERSLNRKIEIADVRFNLFRGPGFSLRNVVIHEDPALGIEPLAYVSSIEARVRLWSLLKRQLEFSGLRLEEPSVNLARSGQEPWNFQRLLSQTAAARLPAITVNNGRLNFKSGDVKSVFYFSGADLRVQPPRTSGGAFSIEFSGQPARTDRTVRGFGMFTARGQWRPSSAPGGELELEVNLERSSLGELVALLHGQDIGLHGQASGEAVLRGSASNLAVNGTLQITDIHRWDQLPPYAQGGPLPFRGSLDLPQQRLELETAAPGDAAFRLRLLALGLLMQPRWSVSADLNEFQIAPLVELARHMGVSLAETVQMEGRLSGSVTYSPGEGATGNVVLRNTSIRLPNAAPLGLAEAKLELDGDHVKLAPSTVRTGEKETGQLGIDYQHSSQRLDLRLSAERMSIATLRSEGGVFPTIPKPQFVASFSGGDWSGRLRYRREADAAGGWSGTVRLRGTRVEVPGLTQAIELHAATVELRSERMLAKGIQASVGGVDVQGEYSHEPGALRPDRIHLRVSKLLASQLEGLLAPTVHRPQSLLARTLRFGRTSLPPWLAARRAEGVIEIGALTLAGERLDAVNVRFFWDGPIVDVPRFTARARRGEVGGHMSIDLRGAEASYEVCGRLDLADYRAGRLSGDAVLRTSGFGEDLYWNLRAEGAFRASGVSLDRDLRAKTLTGLWQLSWEQKQPRLQLSDIRLADGQDVLTGRGLTAENGQLRIELTGEGRRIQLTGALRPFQLGAPGGQRPAE